MRKPFKRLLGFAIILTLVIGAFVPLMKASGLPFAKGVLVSLAIVAAAAILMGIGMLLAWCFDDQ
jgi:hypothetical protein